MTRKHYCLMASYFAKEWRFGANNVVDVAKNESTKRLINGFINVAKDENPKFDEGKFRLACGL